MTHIPCPNCETGWLMPEVGHTHLRPCPICHGHGYLTLHKIEPVPKSDDDRPRPKTPPEPVRQVAE